MSKEIQKISCVNSAAFVMSFDVMYAEDEKEKKLWSSDSFPVGQSRTIDLAEYKGTIAAGAPVWVKVHAKLGKTKSSNEHAYKFAENGQSLALKVKGTTLIYSIEEL